jgi:hypothetical protein
LGPPLGVRTQRLDAEISPGRFRRANEDADGKRILGTYSDILWNWMRLVPRARLCPLELSEVHFLFATKVGFPDSTTPE